MTKYIEDSKIRLLKYVKLHMNGCWEWMGYKCNPKKQYGFISLAIKRPYKMILAHRASYILWKGNIQDEMNVLHSCHNSLCVNPDHLHLGTQRENLQEMKDAGREKKVKGIKNHKSKTNDNDVSKIRRLHENGFTMREIGNIFNLQSSTICYIVNKKTWGHV